MSSNIKTKTHTSRQWRWFFGLYAGSAIAYGVVITALHYLNAWLVQL